jgi:hypothetical protein
MAEEMTSAEVRSKLVEALRLDLVGPGIDLGDPEEVLVQAPSRWYLTGFLVPLGAKAEQRIDETADDDLDQAGEAGGDDEDVPTEKASARPRYFPSSIGASVLVPAGTTSLKVCVRWGDYRHRTETAEEWVRKPHEEVVSIDLTKATEQPREQKIPNSDGLVVAYLSRPVGLLAAEADVPAGARTASVFVVNRRAEAPDAVRDEAFAFQVQLEISGHTEFLRRPDLRGIASDDWDERVADLQYQDAGEYSVGHNVATDAIRENGVCCKVVRTCWIPNAEVEKVEAATIPGVELSMDVLAGLADGADAKEKLSPLVDQYRKWIQAEADLVPKTPAKRHLTGQDLVNRAKVAANRIESGIELLSTPDSLQMYGRGRPTALGRDARQAARGCEASMETIPVGVFADELEGDCRPGQRRPECGGPAVLPHRRRQDRSVFGTGGLHAGIAEIAESGDHLSGPERVDALHSAATDV